ncbi:hypothetical protein FACS189440_22050 [Bacteroidia bacterium]|nr:hypothetical protein FACS189440_22050 [Bacteroidia bacterium]
MKTIKLISLSVLVILLPFLFTGCDAVDKLTTINIPLDAAFDIPFSVDPELRSTSDDPFYHFSGESTISLNSPGFNQLSNYKGLPISLLLTDVKLKVTSKDGSGTTVKNFASSTKEGTTSIANYTKEAPVSLNTEFSEVALTNYLKKAITAVQDGKTVTLDVNGDTDIVPSEIEGVEVGVVTLICTITAQVSLTK